MINPKLKNKVILITGGNHGIGAVTAKVFAYQGAKVFMNYMRLKPNGKIKKVDKNNPNQQNM